MNERMKRVLCALATAAVLFAVTGLALSPEGSRRGAQRAALPSAAPTATQTPAPSDEGCYMGNANSRVFHRMDCSSLSRTADENKVPFSSRQEALDAGYTPCGRCEP